MKKYFIDDSCMGCRGCISVCPLNAIIEDDEKYVIVEEKCVGCGKCADICPMCIPQLVEC